MNAITLLHEHASSDGLEFPKYTLVKEILPNGIQFTCTCECGILKTSASSSSKNGAKHEAAMNMVEKMGLTSKLKTTQAPIVNEEIPVECNEPVINAVGELNQFCAKNKLGYPSYDFIAHTTVQCVLKSFITVGQGINKKQAKQNASIKMLKLVKEDPCIQLGSSLPPYILAINGIANGNEVINVLKQIDMHNALLPEHVQKQQLEECKERKNNIIIKALNEKLKQLRIQYNIFEITSYNSGALLVLESYNCNKTGTPTSQLISLASKGENYSDAMKNLLVDALDFIEFK